MKSEPTSSVGTQMKKKIVRRVLISNNVIQWIQFA